MRHPDINRIAAALLVLLMLCVLAPAAHAATRYAVANANWNVTSTWSTSSGGGSGASVPVAGDTVFIGEAGARTVTISAGYAAACATLTIGNTTKVGSSTLTLAAASVSLTVSGAVIVNSANNNNTTNALNVNAGTLSVGGNFTLNGGNGQRRAELLISTSTATISGNLGVANANSRVTFSGAGALNLAGNFANGGTFTRSTGTVTYNGTGAQNVGAYTYNNLTINKASGTASLTANLPVAGNLSVTAGTLDLVTFTANRTAAGGVFSVANNATLKLSASNFPSNNYTTRTLGPTSTVNYNGGGTQTVSSHTYGHLSLSGGSTKTPASGTTTIAGNFTLASGVTYAGTTNNPIIFLAGNFSNSGTFNSGTGIYTFNGATAQTLTGATTFRNLTINKTTGTPNNQLTLNNDITVGIAASGTLRLTNGVIVTGANKVIIALSTGAVTRTNGHVAGNQHKIVTTGANVSRTFEIGDATTYRPATLLFASVTGAGSVMATSSQTAGDHSVAGSGIDTTKSVNRYWTLTNVATTFTTYSATFTFVTGDLDAGTNTNLFLIKRYAASAWSSTTIGTKTATSTQATGLTGFGDFVIGQAGNLLNNFLISFGASASSTCVAKNITITARDAGNVALTSYTGTINLSTSTAHGDWSKITALGTLTAGASDSGMASYTFVSGDSGVITLAFSNSHADNPTLTVSDASASVNTTSAALNFNDNVFVVTEDPIQVAGLNQTLSATVWRKDLTTGSCSIATGYAGATPLKAWLSRTVDDPAGAAPMVGTQQLPNTQPAAGPLNNNLTLSFTAGVATFSLVTSDVGKYAFNLLDDTHNFAGIDILGASNIITTRPFGLAFTNIQSGATTNPGGAAFNGIVFIKAGQTFQAKVGGYLHENADDTNNDGIPDVGADLTNNTLAPAFAWPITLAPVLNTPSGGVTGTLAGTTSIAQASFSGGAATVSDLTYSEVGSIKITASGTNYLNSSGVNLSATSGIIGRFIPDHFDVSYNTPEFNTGCAVGAFTYLGQVFNFTAGNAPVMTVSAHSASTGTPITKNYSGAFWKLTNSTLANRLYSAASGTLDISNLPPSTSDPAIVDTGNGVFSSADSGTGTLTFSVGTGLSFQRILTAPFAAEISLGIDIIDGDGVALTSTTAAFGAATPGNGIAFISGKEMRFGRLALQNAYGSELLDMPINLTAEYYADVGGAVPGTNLGFVPNTDDTCTAVAATNVTLNPTTFPTSLSAVASNPFSSGNWHDELVTGTHTRLTAPVPATQGSVDLTVDLDAASLGWLKYDWNGDLLDDNPTARAVFGIFQGSERRIYLRER